MGKALPMRSYRAPKRPLLPALPLSLRRTRPRQYEEWKALHRWRKLPPWEPERPGYVLRLAREKAGLTQHDLARRLGCSQQAVAQAERWNSNPTVAFMTRWAVESGCSITIELLRPRSARAGSLRRQ